MTYRKRRVPGRQGPHVGGKKPHPRYVREGRDHPAVLGHPSRAPHDPTAAQGYGCDWLALVLQRLRGFLADTRPLKQAAFRRLWIANIVTVIGAQWGDEGKGKVVDWLEKVTDAEYDGRGPAVM